MEKIRVLIVIADFYKDIAKNLLDGAIDYFDSKKIEFDVVKVPGALEISQTIKFYHESNINFDGYLALGCVIKGETYHFELVSNESASSLSDLSIKYSIPIGNGILTTYNKEQAILRSNHTDLNKAREAANACLEMIKIKNSIRSI